MKLAYEAVNAEGKTVHGHIEADTELAATEALGKDSLFVTRMRATGDSLAEPFGANESVTIRRSRLRGNLVGFCRGMSMLLRSGSGVVPAMYAMEKQCKNARWRDVVRDVRTAVEQGSPLAEALEEHPEVFDPAFRALVTAGENTATLPAMFERLGMFAHRERELHKKLTSAAVYPAVLLSVCVGVITVLIVFVLPKFAELFSTLGTDLPAMTSFLLSVSAFVRSQWIVLTVCLGVLVAGMIMVTRSAALRRAVVTWITINKYIGVIIRGTILARSLRLWAVLLHGHIPMLQALEIMKVCTNNPPFRRLFEDMITAITEGRTVGAVVAQSELIPPTVMQAVQTGEESATLPDSLLFLADSMDEDNERTLTTAVGLLEPLMLVVMGGVVGLVATSLFLPLFDAASSVTR